MAEPRVLEEREIPEVVPFPAGAPIGMASGQSMAPPRVPNLAVVYQGIAAVLASRLQCLLLVTAMIVLSGAAVLFPMQERLIGAAGFDVLALVGLVILGRRP